MKKLSLIIAIAIIFTTLFSATVSSAKLGEKLGDVLNTDIKVYINNQQIPAYAVNNKMAVIMEDLDRYGFDVKYNNTTRELKAYRKIGKEFNPIKNIAGNTNKPGSVAFPYVYTDIITYADNKKIESFAINGQCVIYIDDLSEYGDFVWNDKTRLLYLNLNDKPEKYTPPYYTKENFFRLVTEKDGTQYLLHEPKIKNTWAKKYPVLVSLHAQGEGYNVFIYPEVILLSEGLVEGIISRINENPDYWESYVVLPVYYGWGPPPVKVKSIIDKIINNTAADPDRVYITGVSMGGIFTCDFLYAYPETVACVVPIAGFNSPSGAKIDKVLDIPIRLYHSSDDYTIPISNSRNLYKRLVDRGSKSIEFFELEGYGHYPFDYVYRETDAIDWMYKQNRAKR